MRGTARRRDIAGDSAQQLTQERRLGRGDTGERDALQIAGPRAQVVDQAASFASETQAERSAVSARPALDTTRVGSSGDQTRCRVDLLACTARDFRDALVVAIGDAGEHAPHGQRDLEALQIGLEGIADAGAGVIEIGQRRLDVERWLLGFRLRAAGALCMRFHAVIVAARSGRAMPSRQHLHLQVSCD